MRISDWSSDVCSSDLNCIRSVVMVGSLFGGSLKVSPKDVPVAQFDPRQTGGPKLAVLAGGCFWCVEAVYKDLDGVLSVTSGYAGGSADTADYKTVCTGQTEHAEVIQIAYDPARTSFGKLLKIFFAVAHDPTQLNRQGNDVGAQYRSAILDRKSKRLHSNHYCATPM